MPSKKMSSMKSRKSSAGTLDDDDDEIEILEGVEDDDEEEAKVETPLTKKVSFAAPKEIEPTYDVDLRAPKLRVRKTRTFSVISLATLPGVGFSLNLPSAGSPGLMRKKIVRLKTMTAPAKRPELLRLDSVAFPTKCDVCDRSNAKGVNCHDHTHFICQNCFSSHVRALCCDFPRLRDANYAIACPITGCPSKPWNSYHVRKLLDGETLDAYIEVLMYASNADEGGMGGVFGSPVARGRGGSGGGTPLEGRYAMETMEMLKLQLRNEGKTPIEYIPLSELRLELETIFARANEGLPFDEKRLDYLLLCMDLNPEYKLEQEEESRRWREKLMEFTTSCLEIMRGYVPPHIFNSSVNSLVHDDGLPPELAKRLINKKCLWLIRLDLRDVEVIHEVELMGRFNPEAQQLDIVELAAIFACVPVKFSTDPSGRKERWRKSLETNVKNYFMAKEKGKLSYNKVRAEVYQNNKLYAPFADKKDLHHFVHTKGIE